MKNFELKSFPDDAALTQAAVSDWLNLLQKTGGTQTVAFSGGRIARDFFRAAAELGGPSAFGAVDFFWADERCVPPEHPDSNYKLAKENLFDKVNVAPAKIHRLKGELPPDEAVNEANATIERIATRDAAGRLVLDLVFLGMGENGHVASLMPNLPPAAAATQASYLRVKDSPKPPPDRISLSYSAIAAAKAVWVLVSGAGKEQAFRDSLQPGGKTPLAHVLQSRAATVIYSDIKM